MCSCSIQNISETDLHGDDHEKTNRISASSCAKFDLIVQQ
jgi:hypothetical protein